jgi:hypothetical protein
MSSQAEKLTALLTDIRAETEDYYRSLTESARVANGSWEDWSPKDVLAHLYFWQNNLLVILNGLQETPPEQEPFMERNRKNYLNFVERPWSEVNTAYSRSLDEILARVAAFGDAELTTPGYYPRLPGNNTLQGTILGNTYSHSITHISELIGKRDGVPAGQEFQERATQKLIAFDPSPGPKGVALYNLACSYALVGNTRRAVELLRESFPLRPDLLKFSHEDTDFDRIRHQPEFQALYDTQPATPVA